MTYNVLVAESDNVLWTAIAHGVRRYQPEAAIVRVKDGEQAMRYLFQRGLFTEEPETPQLIVLATELPIVPADAVIERLLQHPRTQAIPVIVIRPDEGQDDFDEQLTSELYLQSQPRVVELFATAKLEKDLATALSRLHATEAPREASAPYIPG